MAEQITQTLGFDASGAITTINTLNAALATLSTNLTNAAGGAKAFNQSGIAKTFSTIKKNDPSAVLNNTATAAGNVGTKLNNAGNKGGAALDNLNSKTKTLSVSFGTLGRVIATQVIVRAFSSITRAIGASIEETRDLQKRIGEIRTLQGESPGTQGEIFAGLQATAETFGFDILDVAEAKYQELSNQVDGSTKSLEFQNAAATLARATNSSLTDSTNLLSSALNAFGKDASQSNEVAGLLFKTIEQGRIRASELANSLGRVAPISNALGVDFNELGAALARVTQGGTKADTAITQILGIMNKLSKPTEALSAAFRELGVATAQEGIAQAGGLLPFLKQIQEVAGDDAALVGFFNNVRAIQGILALLGTDAEKTSGVFENLQATTTEASAALEEANKRFLEGNDAATYDQLVQKLSGTFRTLATDVIPLVNTALEFFIGILDKIGNNKVLTGSILLSGAVAMVAFGNASLFSAAGVSTLTGAAGALLAALAPLAISLGIVAGAAIILNNALVANAVEGYRPLVERATKTVNEFNERVEANSKSLKEQADAFRATAQAAVEFGAQFRTLRKEAQSAVTELNREFVTSSESALDSIVKSRVAVSKQIQDAVLKADSLLEKSADRIANLQVKKDDFLLNQRIKNLNAAAKAQALFQASQTQAFDAKGQIKGTTDLEEFDSAADVLERRLKLAQQGLAAAKESGNAGLIAQAEQQVVTALNDQINLEKQRSQIINQRREAAKAAAAEDAAQTKRLKSLVTDIKKELDIVNNNGGLLNQQQLDQQRAKVTDLLGELREFGLDADQIGVTEFLGIQDLAGQFESALNQGATGIAAGRPAVVAAAQATFDELNALVDDNVIQAAIELDFTKGGPDQIAVLISALAEGKKEIDRLTGAEERFNTAQEKVAANQQLIRDLFQDTTGPGNFANEVNAGVKAITENTFVSSEQVAEFAKQLKLLAVTTDLGNKFDLGGEAGDRQVITELINLFDQLQQSRIAAAEASVETGGDRNRLREVQEFQAAAQANLDAANAFLNTTNNARDATGQVTAATLANVEAIEANVSAWNLATSGVIAYANAIRAIPSAPAPPNVNAQVNRMFGGPLYRAAGGAARGSDTIPAMLSPGEFVVNARSSAKYASQLIAMNAGVNPVYRAEGGAVNNNTVNVGDINVNGTSNPDDTARLVLSKIRREFRRGTASRF